MAGCNMMKRAEAYGIPARKVNGNKFEEVHYASAEIIEVVRKGNGPYLLECETYRIEGHYYGDAMVYRSNNEVEEWRRKDPINHLETLLINQAIVSEEECRLIETEIRMEVSDAVDYAISSPEPAMESIFEDIYTEENA